MKPPFFAASLLPVAVAALGHRQLRAVPTDIKAMDVTWTKYDKHCFPGNGADDAILSTGAVKVSNVQTVEACQALCTGSCEGIVYSLASSLEGAGHCYGRRNLFLSQCREENPQGYETYEKNETLSVDAKGVVSMVMDAQEVLRERIAAARADIEEVRKRLVNDDQTANFTQETARLLSINVNGLTSLAMQNNQSMVDIQANRDGLNTSSEKAILDVENAQNETLADISGNLSGAADMIESVTVRVKANTRTLEMLRPRMERMEDRVDNLEHKQRYGNLTRVVDVAVNRYVNKIFQDVGRSLLNELPDK